ncbi:MAG TPA: rod shape-determining protein RodA [Gemmatimonadaceae bacterium]|nr:rod shape-determining protein RodA [Gemmatimonadaceae bacterium]
MAASRRLIADVPLVGTALLLSIFGILMVYSAGQTDVLTFVARLWKSQIVWLVVGIAAAYAISRASVRFVDWLTLPAYSLSVILLAVTLVLGSGAGTAASTKSWLTIGGIRIGQPAELAKITVVLMLARVLAARKEAPRSLLELWLPIAVVAIPWLLIMMQPDLGTAIVFIGILFAMLYWSGVSLPLLVLLASPGISLILAFSTGIWATWFFLLVVLLYWYKPYLLEGVALAVMNIVIGVAAPFLWEQLKPYQRQRLLVFLDPSQDPRASGYHVIQSQVAIGSGGWFGKGFTQGTQKRLAFLPEQHTDFIFSVVGEELGFFGVTLAIALFCYLFLRAIRIASGANDSFAGLVACGVAASWFVHVLVNVGMTLSLMPITGIPLPFFSYGGSFMLSCWLGIGILLRISSEGRGGRDGTLAI